MKRKKKKHPKNEVTVFQAPKNGKMTAKKIQRRNLEDFSVDGFFLLVEKSHHLNSQVSWETAELRLQTETCFKTQLGASKRAPSCTTHRFYIQGVSLQGCGHFRDFLL